MADLIYKQVVKNKMMFETKIIGKNHGECSCSN